MNWTESELQFLREKRGSMTTAEIAQALGRRKWEVKEMVTRLGIQRPMPPFIRWTPEEEQTLAQLHPAKTLDEIAAILGRPPSGVKSKIMALGLSGPNRVRPLGTERMDPQRGLVRKVRESGPKHVRWERVEVIEWERVNGPVPSGHVLIRKNPALQGSLDNLTLITRGELIRSMGIHQMPEDLQELYRIKSQITKAVKRLSEEKTPAP